MKKHMLPGTTALAKRMFAIVLFSVSVFVANAQCLVATETNPNNVNPTGCSNGSVSLGSGAYFNITVSANAYYNFSWTNSGAANMSSTAFCADPQNGSGSSGSFTANTTNWFSGTTTTLRISSNRTSSTWVATSGVMTYRFATPTSTPTAVATTVCQGSTINFSGSATTFSTGYAWSGPNSFTSSILAPTVANAQPGVNNGTYTLVAQNPNASGCTASGTVNITVNTAATVSAGSAQTICAGSTATMSGSFGGSATSATWSTSGTGTFNNNNPTAVYTPSLADISAGSVTLTYTTNDPAGPCGAVSASITLTINPVATVSAGGNQTICAGSSATMAGSFGGGASSATWGTSGTGTFNSNATNAIYTPSSADISAGSVTLTYTTNDPAGPCNAVSASMILTINPIATVSAGSAQTICAGSTATMAGSFGGSASSATWSTSGSGNFNNNNPGAIYTPSLADISAGSVTLTYTTNDPAGPCNAASASILLTINPLATVSAGSDQTICSNTTATMAGSFGGGATSATWSTSGTGTFNSNNPGAIYTPSNADIAAGSVILTYTTNDPAGPCNGASATMTLTINQAATVSAGANQNICEGSTATMAGSFGGGATSATWSTSGTGGFSNNTPTAVYTPSGADALAGSVTLTYTTNDPAGPCNAASASMILTIGTAVTVDAGGPDVVCQSGTGYLLSGATIGGGATSASWAITGGTGTGTLSSTLPTASPASVTFTPTGAGTITLTLTTNDPAGACPALSDSRSITINSLPTPTVGVSETSGTANNDGTTCSGDNVILTGNPGGFVSYNWNQGLGSGQTQSVNPIGTTTYTVTVTDGNSCTAAASATINVNPLPAATVTVAETSGNGNNDGTTCSGDNVTLTANPNAMLSYVWNNSLPSQQVNTIAPTGTTTYSVTVTNVNNCSAAASAVITVNPRPTPTISVTETSGVANDDGTICSAATVTLTGNPNAMTSYAWNNALGSGQVKVVNPTLTTTYTLTVTDGNNCSASNSTTITVNQYPIFSAQPVVTAVLCNGGNTGTITVSASSSNLPISYSDDNGGSFQGSNVFTGLTAGNYDLVITDNAACSTTYPSNPVIVTEPPVLTHTTVDVNASCSNVFDGKITVTATGGFGTYNYSLNGGPSQTGNVFTGLSSGVYIVKTTDANGCFYTTNDTIRDAYGIAGSVQSQTNVSCFGGGNGAVTVQIDSFGVSPYSYSINGVTFQPGGITFTFTGLTAGNYVATIRDSKGCSAFVPVTITQPAQLQAQIDSVINISCNGGGTGAIYISVTGGTAPYRYTWSNTATTQDITNLTAGTYNVAILDTNGCNAAVGATITQPIALFLNVASFSDLRCYNDSSGSINVSVNGGVPPYNFNWSNGATTEDLSGLKAGTYSLTVTDNNGCQQSVSQTIAEPTQLTAGGTTANVTCNGFTNGSIDLTVSNGTAPYTFQWNNGATTEDLNGIGAGTYNVVVNDAHSCNVSRAFTITQPAPLSVAVSVTNVGCNGNTTGAIDLTVSGGTPIYVFQWSNSLPNTEDQSGLSAGTYTVTVVDDFVCSVTATATITQPAQALSGTLVATDVTCNGANNGSVNLTLTGGTLPYTYIWNNNATTEDLTGLGPNTYSVTATDANGCTFGGSAVVNEPAALNASIAGTNVSCYGGNDGAADLTVTGGNPGYTYLWSTFASTQDLTGLTANNYVVIVTDSKNCQTISSVTITQPTQLSITANVTNISCSGGTTGSIDITVTGGTGAYSYLWSNTSTSEDQTALIAGTYSVVATDANNCTVSASYTITQPVALSVSGVATNVTCNGGSNGAVNLTVSGGVAPYNYSWSPNGQTTEDISGLTANTYSVVVTDANTCTGSATFVITEPAGIISSITGTNVTCNGASNGAADLTVSGGTSPYTYLWSYNFQAQQDLNNVPGGVYAVIITDANGCTKRDSVIITEPAALVLTTTVTNVLCNGAATGAVDLTVTGGTGAYTYDWSNNATTEDISGLTAGTYTVTVEDANNCTATASVTITQPAGLVLNATTTNVGCAGGANGSVDITVQGGVFPYSFAWSNNATTEDINGLSGGTYTVTITDANGCTVTGSYVITEPTAITSSVAGTNVTCNGASNGAADLTVSGGTSPYTYLWSNFQATQDLSNIGGGTYYVVITDANGCTKRDSVVITEPAALVLTTTVTNVLCNGAATGAVDLTVTGGTGAYTYDWSNNATTEDISGLTAGTYTVTVEDANNCTATASVTITQPAGLVLNATTTNVGCAGGANGSVDITVQGGVFPYSFAWSNNATTEDINGLSGGTYTVTITDANGCTVTGSYVITEPTAITSSVTGTNVTCNGASNGAADLTVSGGTSPYTYLWSNFQATQDLSNIGGGTYYVVITDANGCTKRDSVIITEPAALVLTTTVTNVLCNGAATGAVDLTVTGGTGAYTYDWSNNATTEDISGLTAGTYTVTVGDANNCTATASVTITQPAGLVLNATTTNVGCAGGANGSVDITVQGGVFPYSFAWSNNATTEDINGLSGGTYTVTITDANGCTVTGSYVITEPTAITSSVIGTNVLCFGGSTGTTDLTVSGGTTPYTYLWSTFQAQQDLTNLPAGTYYVIITDANGCTHRDSVIITEPAALVLSTTVTNVSCNGNATGAVDLTVTGGTGTYDYEWNSGPTTEDLTNVVAGTYVVTVTDDNGCTATATATVTQPALLSLTGVVTNVSCAGGNDGQVNTTVVGGTLPYVFTWSNGANTEDIQNLTVGTYSVSVVDANGCSATATYNITEPTAITSSIVGTDVSCQGGNTGSADLTVSGGVTPYTYFWSNFQTTEDISGLGGGVYFVIITDANGCTHRDSVVINEPAPITLSTAVTQISCFNANDGAIDLTVNGGTQPYVYSWNSGQSTQDISGLSGNTYSVLVTDDNGCTATTSALIINPSNISTNVVTYNPLCSGDTNGRIDLIATGGTPNYTYLWNTGDTTEDISNIGQGVYSITITDSRGCTRIDSFTITEPGPLFTSGFIKNVTCFGNNDGCVDITAYGGTLPYSYLWSTGQSTEDICSLGGVTTYVTVTDYNGCQVVSSYEVREPAQLVLDVTGTNVSCYNGNNGTLTAMPSGGTLPYEYVWDDFATDSLRGGITAGHYVLLLTDSNGCHTFDSIQITQPTEIAITGLVNNATCFNAATGGIDITVTGGTPAYSYFWTSGATTEDITAVAAGPYTVTVTDANQCEKTASFTITQPSEINLTLLSNKPTCNGAANGSLSVIAIQGVTPYTYNWSTTPAQTTATASDLAAGTFTVTVTDANGCTSAATETLTAPPALDVTTNAVGSRCFNVATGYVTSSVAGGRPPYVYQLNGVTQDTSVFYGLAPGNYVLLVTDANGCQGTSSFTIASPGQITVDLTASEQIILTGMKTQLVANATSSKPIIGYVWEPGSAMDYSQCGDSTNCSNPYAMPLSSTIFTVTVMNEDSCTATDTITIYVNNELSAFVPTAFTPNNDGLNDRFAFDILGATNLDVKIFNRWGQAIYVNANQPNGLGNGVGWDGTVDGKDAPSDTYVWQITVTYFDGRVVDNKGTVTLMR